MKVCFYEKNEIKDSLLKFVVIISRYNGKWIFCKHRERNTFEFPGGHIEENEPIEMAARRELFEETGAIEYDLTPICVYSVKRDFESFGMLYFSEIKTLGNLPDSEIEKIEFFNEMPINQTYPLIQPKLFEKVLNLNI